MNVGDWVFFRTRNWPSDVQRMEPEDDTAETKNVRGEPYAGRGRVVGVAGKNYTVREDKPDRLVEVGPHSDDEIRPFGYDLPTLMLGDLRAFLEKHKGAPDEVPSTVSMPLSFFSDLDEMPLDHPEYKAVSECCSVAVSGIFFEAIHESGDSAERYIPLKEREREDWDFSIEIVPHAGEIMQCGSLEANERCSAFSVNHGCSSIIQGRTNGTKKETHPHEKKPYSDRRP